MKLTTRIKLHTDAQSHAALLETMSAFNAACQYISDYAFEHRVFHKHNLQDRLYGEVKARFSLPAQLVVRAFAKVGDAYRTARTQLAERVCHYEALSEKKKAKRKKPQLRVCRFKDTGAVVYDRRLPTYQHNASVSIRAKHQRFVLPVDCVPNLNRLTIKGEADLVLDNHVFYLLQTLQVPEGDIIPADGFLGVDVGMVHIAYDSDGHAYDDPGIDRKRQQYENRRTSLKQRKTKNSRRRLKKMGKKLARFRKDTNHRISKALVQKAKALGKGLAMEKLANFFDKTKVRRTNRAERHSWAFFQLRSFVEYKARREGVSLILVEAADSSQECCVCHTIDRKNRVSQALFRCRCCGYTQNADFNAARIVKYRAESTTSTCQNSCLQEGDAAATGGIVLPVGSRSVASGTPAASPLALAVGS